MLEAAPAPIPTAVDLSEGQLKGPDAVQQNLGIQEQAHRLRLQLSISNSALSIATVLIIAAIFFGGCLIYALVHEKGDIHWHASILVAAFIVPPTVIIIALLRSVYQVKQKEEAPSAPLVAMIKEVVNAIASAFKKGD